MPIVVKGGVRLKPNNGHLHQEDFWWTLKTYQVLKCQNGKCNL